MMQCLKYKGNELLKMYPTWTKSEAKKLTRLKEKRNKTLPNISNRPNDDAIKHPSKKVASISLKFQDKTLAAKDFASSVNFVPVSYLYKSLIQLLFLSYCACLLNRSIIWKPRYFDFRAWNPHLPKKFVNWTSSPVTDVVGPAVQQLGPSY